MLCESLDVDASVMCPGPRAIVKLQERCDDNSPPTSLQSAEDSPFVLLLGEANFSFAAALAALLDDYVRSLDKKATRKVAAPTKAASQADRDAEVAAAAADQAALARVAPAFAYLRFPTEQQALGARILATSFEGDEEVLVKYPETTGILSRMVQQQKSMPSSLGRMHVKHCVNAWDLQSSFGHQQLFDIIAWNHPHLGTEDFRLHRFLLAHFFASADASLRPCGRIVLSLVEGQEKRWELVSQAARQGFVLVAIAPFRAFDWPGYECKRNTTGKSFKNLPSQRQQAGLMRSWTYHLARAADSPLLEALPPDAPQVLAPEESFKRTVPAAGHGKEKALACNVPDADPTTYRPAARFACHICTKEFSCKQGLKTHVRQVHELQKYGNSWQQSEASKECTECGKSFKDEGALQQHLLAVHSGGDVSKVRGARGPSTLGFGSTLDDLKQGEAGRSPLDAVHEDDEGYGYTPCPVCGMAVPKGTAMADHLEALKPLVNLSLTCELCSKPFVETRALQQHMRFCRADAEAKQQEGCRAPPQKPDQQKDCQATQSVGDTTVRKLAKEPVRSVARPQNGQKDCHATVNVDDTTLGELPKEPAKSLSRAQLSLGQRLLRVCACVCGR
eukprot:TRINITY_DN24727_c0_g1_i1.p1 TRINITY_DN24727_c0_g1~~TRINITY_DN24727_c0_g1_i1.p1  ORF type:complete len:645 (-),score=122.53 TRINITY_DN24727_c0_g1_i1:191-2047(-)